MNPDPQTDSPEAQEELDGPAACAEAQAAPIEPEPSASPSEHDPTQPDRLQDDHVANDPPQEPGDRPAPGSEDESEEIDEREDTEEQEDSEEQEARQDSGEQDDSGEHKGIDEASTTLEMILQPAVEDEDPLTLRSILFQTLLASLFLLALVGGLALLLKEPMTQAASWAVEELGMVGIFFGVLAADTLSLPISVDAYLFFAVASNAPMVEVIVICSIASILGGNLSYFVGPSLVHMPWVGKRLEKFRPRGERLFERYGFWAIVIAALSPVPFCITCWIAGIYKMDYKRFFIGTIFRIPRLIGYYLLFVLGWATNPVA